MTLDSCDDILAFFFCHFQVFLAGNVRTKDALVGRCQIANIAVELAWRGPVDWEVLCRVFGCGTVVCLGNGVAFVERRGWWSWVTWLFAIFQVFRARHVSLHLRGRCYVNVAHNTEASRVGLVYNHWRFPWSSAVNSSNWRHWYWRLFGRWQEGTADSKATSWVTSWFISEIFGDLNSKNWKPSVNLLFNPFAFIVVISWALRTHFTGDNPEIRKLNNSTAFNQL